MRRDGDTAVTAIVGTALLLAITMVLFSVLNMVVFSFPVHPRSPSVSLVASMSNDTIIIEHNGGESLSENEIQIIVSNSSDLSFVANGIYYPNDGMFNIGDRWEYIDPDLIDENVSVTVVHLSTNSILMMGIVQRGD